MDRLKKRSILIFVCVIAVALFLVLLVIPLIINFFFSLTAPLKLLEVDWNASDALSYFGSVLGGIGTIFLGVITICQTNRINQKNLENEQANTKRPFFIIEEISFDKKSDKKLWDHGQNGFFCTYYKSQYAFIKVINIGDGVANNLIIEPWGFGDIPKEERPALCVQPKSFCTIPVLLPEKTEQHTQFIQVKYENIIGYAYSQKIELRIDFYPEVVGINETDNGENFPEYQERYQANIFNIYPKTPLSMNKYDPEKGKYICQE